MPRLDLKQLLFVFFLHAECETECKSERKVGLFTSQVVVLGPLQCKST